MRISICLSHRAPATASPSGERRHGISLVEVIVAMVLLAIAVTSLAAMVGSVSRSGIRTSGDAYKNGVLMNEVNRLEGIPFDSVAVGSSYTTVSTGSYPHTRYVTVTSVQADVIKSIKVVIKPVNPNFKSDSVTFIRTKSRTSRVLCTDCPQG
ncbi:MAG: prepilin-type N-terminal cleavage/methylation domain-containing protein [Gemmatimonadaceae bacterium]